MHKALNNMKTCDCGKSCYNCLRSYDSQKIHDDLDRELAEKFLSKFVGNIEIVKNDDLA